MTRIAEKIRKIQERICLNVKGSLNQTA